MIAWGNFLLVFGTSLVATAVIVSLFALGLRLLTASGRTPIVEPAEFTDQITVIDADQAKAARKAVKKARKHNTLTDRQKQSAYIGAWVCFVLSGCAVIYGIYLIIPAFHH